MKIKRNSVFSTESSTIQLGRAAKYWRKYNWPTTEHTITTPTRVSGYSLSSANASGGKSGGGPHTNNNFVIDVNDPEEMGQVERNIKKRMARRDGLMRQVWNEVVFQNQAFNNTTITKNLLHLPTSFFVFIWKCSADSHPVWILSSKMAGCQMRY